MKRPMAVPCPDLARSHGWAARFYPQENGVHKVRWTCVSLLTLPAARRPSQTAANGRRYTSRRPGKAARRTPKAKHGCSTGKCPELKKENR